MFSKLILSKRYKYQGLSNWIFLEVSYIAQAHAQEEATQGWGRRHLEGRGGAYPRAALLLFPPAWMTFLISQGIRQSIQQGFASILLKLDPN